MQKPFVLWMQQNSDCVTICYIMYGFCFELTLHLFYDEKRWKARREISSCILQCSFGNVKCVDLWACCNLLSVCASKVNMDSKKKEKENGKRQRWIPSFLFACILDQQWQFLTSMRKCFRCTHTYTNTKNIHLDKRRTREHFVVRRQAR